eukprot:SAG31_NODE_2876_length_4970_cov_2.820776_5_plen_329_part_00
MAFDEPGLLGQSVYFVVLSDGYDVEQSQQLPFTPHSEPGVLLHTVPGGRATVLLHRTQPGQRMYRMTGGGIYRDSVLVGAEVPIDTPLIGNANVLGQDSLLAAVYKNRAYYFFGDSECPAGPRDTDCQHYGRFTTGAWSCVPGDSSCAAPPTLHYFASNSTLDPGGMAPDGQPDVSCECMLPSLQLSRPCCVVALNRVRIVRACVYKIFVAKCTAAFAVLKKWNPHSFFHPKPMLPGPLLNESTWVGSVVVVKTVNDERMYTTYVCPSSNGAQGIAQWDDTDEVFKSKLEFPSLPGIQWVMGLAPNDEGYVCTLLRFLSRLFMRAISL